MKYGRLILTHRPDLIEILEDFYLRQGRTEFLVLGVDASKVKPEDFKQADNFRIMPFSMVGPGGSPSLTGRQQRVWVEVAKHFSDINSWVIHDYDVVCRPKDAEILGKLSPAEYAMVGKAFPVWQEGMTEAASTYPFPEGHRYWHKTQNPSDLLVDETLMEIYPVEIRGVKTVMGGYSDFVATSRENILLLDDPNPKLQNPDLFGIEQIPHTIWRAKGISPVDMRDHFKLKVLLDVVYIPMDERYDIMSPVKYWPKGEGVNRGVLWKNFVFNFKKLVKKAINYEHRRSG